MNEKGKIEKKRLHCPFCDEEIAELQYPYCEACRVEISTCQKCGEPVSGKTENCPKCGTHLNTKC